MQPKDDMSLSYPRCLLPSTKSLHLPLNGLHKPLLTTKQLLLNPSEDTELAALYVMCGASISVVLADLRSASSSTLHRRCPACRLMKVDVFNQQGNCENS
ncbi:hypothetical protein AHF37_09379 [Paragonimus kellicotti]|nr:hypothetical protein AHF37_09379 [Paragonimus kellicotti]